MGFHRSPKPLPFTERQGAPFPVEVQRFARGHFVEAAGVHGHQFNEIVLFESEGDVHRVGRYETQARTGTVHALGEGQTHKLELTPAARGWMLLFPTAALERARFPRRAVDWLSRPGDDRRGTVALSPARHERISRYFAALEDLQESTAVPRAAAIEALFSLVLRRLEEAHRLATPARSDERHVDALLETIDGAYRERLTLEGLAEKVGLTKAYLTTRIRERTGLTAMQWLLTRRLRAARELLRTGDFTVTQIAHELGFEDSSHFARRFRDVHGRAPAAWRDLHRAEKRNFVPARPG